MKAASKAPKGVVNWDGKYGRWATYFFDVRGPLGDWLCVGHVGGKPQPRWAGAMNMRKEHPFPETAKRRPAAFGYRKAFRMSAAPS